MKKPDSPYLSQKRKIHIPVTIVKKAKFAPWLKQQDARMKTLAAQAGFEPGGKSVLIRRSAKCEAEHIYALLDDTPGIYAMAAVADKIKQEFSEDFLKKASFAIIGLSGTELLHAHIGWGLAAYDFSAYKKKTSAFPALCWAKGVDHKRVLAFTESIFLLRDLVNMPANDLGPDEMENEAKHLAAAFKAQIKIVRGKELEKGFPLIHTVGHGSERRPRLIDITWGAAKNPKITIVGKGVSFDTGGLNLKPTAYMALMKKDMGGAAHALALARMIMALKLPVRLRVLIPAVENSVSGGAFRPGDVIKSRKGITVENTNTDAEGRLILADALAYACEEKPDLLMDFCTLTGSARAALGPDIPALFSNDDKMAAKLQKLSFELEDPLWQMPLWEPYQKHNKSPIADMVNSASIAGDLIYSALFLQKFTDGKAPWLHLDMYSWEQTGRPGRPRGGADTGLRAVFALIEELYGR